MGIRYSKGGAAFVRISMLSLFEIMEICIDGTFLLCQCSFTNCQYLLSWISMSFQQYIASIYSMQARKLLSKITAIMEE